jgi:hypothetical protein
MRAFNEVQAALRTADGFVAARRAHTKHSESRREDETAQKESKESTHKGDG